MRTTIFITFFLVFGHVFAAQFTWDIIDKSMEAWNADGGTAINKAWILAKGTNTPSSGIVTQQTNYVNIKKTNTGSGNHYAFLTPPALSLSTNTPYTFEVKVRINPTDKFAFPDGSSYYESNQISARLNNKNMAIHLKYGDANTGYISIGASVGHNAVDKYTINTSEWHRYRFVFHADNASYNVYVDDSNEPVFENVTATTMTGSNILRLGAETNHRCNMDIEYAKMKTGELSLFPKVSALSISQDSHEFGRNILPVTTIINTTLFEDGSKILLSLVDKTGAEAMEPVEITVYDNKATGILNIPNSVPVGKYDIQVSVPGGTIGEVVINPKKMQYIVADTSPIRTNMFPQVKPVGWAIADINDYKYKNSSNEFIFPSIIDTKQHTIDGRFENGQEPLARYYLFYAPHENPGGIYLSTSNSLEGPWTEQGVVVSHEWALAIPNNIINTSSHISASNVFWNEIYKQYIMYFHGPNSTTHYATSDNLVDWTFGESMLESKQFSPVGAECSYGKCFEHEIPGLGNKYVFLMMNQEGQIRRIYWAYSNDGKKWTAVPKPLVHPDLDYKKIPGTDEKPDYAGTFGTQYGNVAAPYLIERDGRYFVLCHGSSGNMFAVEVGESFDMEVHWGVYHYASDCLIDKDGNGNKIAVPRIASPQFIQDDSGTFYMFFEAGSRLGSNIAYMKEETIGNFVPQSVSSKSVTISRNILDVGQTSLISLTDYASLSKVEIYNIEGSVVYSESVSGSTFLYQVPNTPGLYLLVVKLDNDSSQTFKILVK